jgi:hypothetical protein
MSSRYLGNLEARPCNTIAQSIRCQPPVPQLRCQRCHCLQPPNSSNHQLYLPGQVPPQVGPSWQQIHRYYHSVYSSKCPSCWDFDHTFRTPEHLAPSLASSEPLLTKLKVRSNINPVEAGIIIDGLHHWFHQIPEPSSSSQKFYGCLIASQTEIGWSQLLLGQGSFQWIVHQTTYLNMTGIPLTPRNNGTAG